MRLSFVVFRFAPGRERGRAAEVGSGRSSGRRSGLSGLPDPGLRSQLLYRSLPATYPKAGALTGSGFKEFLQTFATSAKDAEESVCLRQSDSPQPTPRRRAGTSFHPPPRLPSEHTQRRQGKRSPAGARTSPAGYGCLMPDRAARVAEPIAAHRLRNPNASQGRADNTDPHPDNGVQPERLPYVTAKGGITSMPPLRKFISASPPGTETGTSLSGTDPGPHGPETDQAGVRRPAATPGFCRTLRKTGTTPLRKRLRNEPQPRTPRPPQRKPDTPGTLFPKPVPRRDG